MTLGILLLKAKLYEIASLINKNLNVKKFDHHITILELFVLHCCL